MNPKHHPRLGEDVQVPDREEVLESRNHRQTQQLQLKHRQHREHPYDEKSVE
jgi:hypothetical protein